MKRFMVAKKKRANQHHVPDEVVNVNDAKVAKNKNSMFGVDFYPRWTSA